MTLPNVMAANGVIHGIDGVITQVAVAPEAAAAIPTPAQSKYKIPQVLAAYPSDLFSTLLAAVTAADLGPALNGVPGGPPMFTVFAVRWCRLTVSNPVLKALMVSALESI